MKRAALMMGPLLFALLSASIGIEACSSSADPEVSPGDEGGGPDSPGGGGDGGGGGGDAKVDGGGGGGDGSADGAVGQDAAGDANAPGTGISCAGLAATCGGNKDCCASNLVPTGTFNRSNLPAYPATVSDFKLDVYEVTVGRFRAFVDAGKGTQASPPAAGDGLHPKIASSGWDASFNVNLPATTADLKAALKCNASFPSWTDAPGANETNPENCVSWFVAFAFCAWDGGRLPTEAEWNYAAAGGSEQRDRPWGASIDHTRAAYQCSGRGSGDPCSPLFIDMKPVGSFSPAGDGKWGQADLIGNVWEYTLDYNVTPYRLTTCVDCADLQPTADRTFRGGSFANQDYLELTSQRIYRSPNIADYDVGVRCARAAAP